jgi:hypothetical protein
MSLRLPNLLIAALALALTACGSPQSAKFAVNSSEKSSNGDLGAPDTGGGPGEGTPDPDTGSGGSDIGGIPFCSAFLDFDGLTWSKSLSARERSSFALALNISGRFEGRHGWSNLAGNSDGQGISMGLLNQPLGPGSLQPMWAEMATANPALMKKIMTTAHYESMVKMLQQWGAQVKLASLFNPEDYGYNELDDPDLVAKDLGIDPLEMQKITVSITSQNQISVDWAKKNALSGTSIKSDWSAQLKALAVTPDYRSIQVAKAERIHNKTMAMMKTYAGTELRTYLFLFDIAVQNGSIPSSINTKYNTWLKTHKSATEKQRMLQLLEYRLTLVKSQYVADVRARKTAILNGSGTVHGTKYEFEKLYCTSFTQKI